VTDILDSSSPAVPVIPGGAPHLPWRDPSIPPIPPLPRNSRRQTFGIGDSAALEGGLVLGVECRYGHFNDPRIQYCSCCGSSLVHQPHRMRPGRRPPLGVLIFDDGYLYSLDADLVLGSAPGAAEPGTQTMRLSDPEGVLASQHLRVQLHDWDVQVVDLGSAHGTHYARGGDRAWCRIPADMPITLLPGMHVLAGWRRFRYESYRTS
jgi:hypothetical protein